MEIDWIHRPTAADGADGADGTLNLCFNALDRHVVRGLADEPALAVLRMTAGRTELSFARLLEEVAAFGGALRALGVVPGERVLSRLPMGLHGLVAALACTRLGAVHVGSGEYADPAPSLAGGGSGHPPAVVLAEGTDSLLAGALPGLPEPPRAVVWRGSLPESQELEWDVLLRAGRTDPAPVAEVSVSSLAFVVEDRPVTVRQVLDGIEPTWPVDAIGTLMEGAILMLSVP